MRYKIMGMFIKGIRHIMRHLKQVMFEVSHNL